MADIGVLALQGDYEAHCAALRRAGARAFTVRTRAELDRAAGLVIPGGESTTMLKLMEYYGLFEPLKAYGAARPVFGTCAGAILLANEVLNPVQASLGLVDMTIERNAYGRQVDSRIVLLDGLGGEAVFIRAPIIRRMDAGARVLARYGGDPVLVDFGRHLVATFHPELSVASPVHALFLEKVPA
jgi:5'-phosphate synthase pdxT subunit